MSKGFKLTAKLQGSSAVARYLKQHPEAIQRTQESILKQEGRGLGIELARNTRPFGFQDKGRKQGEGAVEADIIRVFALPGDAYREMEKTDQTKADRFWGHIQNRRFARARTALSSSNTAWSDLTIGRLNPDLHKWGDLVGEGEKPKMIVTTAEARARYIGKIQKLVGFAKGGWTAAAKSLGGRLRGASQWVTRHNKHKKGTAKMKKGPKARVTLTNNVDYIDDCTTLKGVNMALEVAQGRLRRGLATAMDKINQKANRALNRRAG